MAEKILKDSYTPVLSKDPPMNLSAWYGSSEDSDADIILADGTKIPVHKIVLKSQCGYFMTMFRSGVGKKTRCGVGRPIIDLSNHPPEAVRHCLGYLYGLRRTRLDEISAREWCELFTLASFLMAEDMVTDMEIRYSDMKVNVPVTDLANLAVSTNSNELMHRAAQKTLEIVSGVHQLVSGTYDIICDLDLATYERLRKSWIEQFRDENYHLFRLDCEYCERNTCDIGKFVGDIAFHQISRDDLMKLRSQKIVAENMILHHLIGALVNTAR